MRRLMGVAMLLVVAGVGTSAQLPTSSPPVGIVMKLNDSVVVQHAVRNDGVLAPTLSGFAAVKCGIGLGFNRYYVGNAKVGWTILHVDSVYAYACGVPKYPLGIPCDSLAKLFKSAGVVITAKSVSLDIQDANATCKK